MSLDARSERVGVWFSPEAVSLCQQTEHRIGTHSSVLNLKCHNEKRMTFCAYLYGFNAASGPEYLDTEGFEGSFYLCINKEHYY